jgi:dihydroneopterin aldolase
MKGLMTVELHNLLFFAYHGLHEEEQKTGNQFRVDLAVTYESPETIETDISETINYAGLYALVKKQMLIPAGLLETLAMTIAQKIKDQHPQIKKIAISIAKLHPPIAGFRGKVGVSYSLEY